MIKPESGNTALQLEVETILDLIRQDSSLSNVDLTTVKASLAKAISPTFEIVFAGAFSAGKSMLINALLERELLYSAEGHATGTQCYIRYAEPGEERVNLTFLSEQEVFNQINQISGLLKLEWQEIKDIPPLCAAIIQSEGGESRSERAKQAKSLILLLEGWIENKDRMDAKLNNLVTMEEFNFSNLQEAAAYARRGKNSAVLKKIEYFCHHPLLADGNVIVDTPGIDAPVQSDAQIALDKVANPDTSAVICVFKTAATGELSTEETQVLELIDRNPHIRDRVFNVFNRIDETWYNSQLRQRLEQQINSQFIHSNRIYRTSGLLGFYGSQIKNTNAENRFGLDTIFAESVKSLNGKEETPQFVTEFIRYCLTSEKLSPAKFPIIIDPRESPTNNQKYNQILDQFGDSLIAQLIKDSGIEEFRSGITHYLTTEKRPQLFATLAQDLQPLCQVIKQRYSKLKQQLDSQPKEIGQMRDLELQKLGEDLSNIAEGFEAHIDSEIAQIINATNLEFNQDFLKLKAKMVSRLDELINTFSVRIAHRRVADARINPRRNTVVPVLAILAEAFYYLANELEDVLVESSTELVRNFFSKFNDRVTNSEYYRHLLKLLGNDGGIGDRIKQIEAEVILVITNQAQTECNRYVRENPNFYTDSTASLWQLRETLQQTCRSYDWESMQEAEPAIRQLLKIDFEPKVATTINRIFRSTIEQTLNTHLTPLSQEQGQQILDRYEAARNYLGESLAAEAEIRLQQNQKSLIELGQKINDYNAAVQSFNNSLVMMNLERHKLPLMDAIVIPVEVVTDSPVATPDLVGVN
jgi:replication fork clamp-binding protein CrfC